MKSQPEKEITRIWKPIDIEWIAAIDDAGQAVPVIRGSAEAEKATHLVSMVIPRWRGFHLLCERSSSKEIYPGFFEIGISEHRQLGESYEEAAHRGLLEEMRVGNQSIVTLGIQRITYESNSSVLAGIFSVELTVPPAPNPNEIAAMELVTYKKLLYLIETKQHRFGPWWLPVFSAFIAQPLAGIHQRISE